MRFGSRIVSEANARGKAARYADGNTIIWIVEASFATTNAFSKPKDE
jgi:hypothetical protein